MSIILLSWGMELWHKYHAGLTDLLTFVDGVRAENIFLKIVLWPLSYSILFFRAISRWLVFGSYNFWNISIPWGLVTFRNHIMSATPMSVYCFNKRAFAYLFAEFVLGAYWAIIARGTPWVLAPYLACKAIVYAIPFVALSPVMRLPFWLLAITLAIVELAMGQTFIRVWGYGINFQHDHFYNHWKKHYRYRHITANRVLGTEVIRCIYLGAKLLMLNDYFCFDPEVIEARIASPWIPTWGNYAALEYEVNLVETQSSTMLYLIDFLTTSLANPSTAVLLLLTNYPLTQVLICLCVLNALLICALSLVRGLYAMLRPALRRTGHSFVVPPVLMFQTNREEGFKNVYFSAQNTLRLLSVGFIILVAAAFYVFFDLTLEACWQQHQLRGWQFVSPDDCALAGNPLRSLSCTRLCAQQAFVQHNRPSAHSGSHHAFTSRGKGAPALVPLSGRSGALTTPDITTLTASEIVALTTSTLTDPEIAINAPKIAGSATPSMFSLSYWQPPSGVAVMSSASIFSGVVTGAAVGAVPQGILAGAVGFLNTVAPNTVGFVSNGISLTLSTVVAYKTAAASAWDNLLQHRATRHVTIKTTALAHAETRALRFEIAAQGGITGAQDMPLTLDAVEDAELEFTKEETAVRELTNEYKWLVNISTKELLEARGHPYPLSPEHIYTPKATGSKKIPVTRARWTER